VRQDRQHLGEDAIPSCIDFAAQVRLGLARRVGDRAEPQREEASGDILAALPEYLQRFRLISTFNGAGFDLRFLRTTFPGLALPPIHVDLRPTTRKLGLTGGLKAIEAAFGLERNSAIRDLSGYDAVILWRKHLRGDRRALELLIEYNRADVVHLKTILEICYDRLASEGLAPAKP
jgi:uncharacterized protein YprB with RNaseH-like and TPR domain